MNVSLNQAAAGLSANSRWQEVIAENLASSSVPGFRKQQLSLAAVQAGFMPAAHLNSSNATQTFTLPKATTSTNFLQGEFQFTGNPYNVAIDGKGFIPVQLPNGSTAYTRDGEFQKNSIGQLVTKEGYRVLGDAGPIQLDPNSSAPITISATGEVSQGSDLKGKLKVTDFDKPQLLTQISGGYFMANNPEVHPTATTAGFRQNYLEGSNTSSVAEMANLMTAMRGFEANQKLVQMQDDRLGRVITDLGNPNS